MATVNAIYCGQKLTPFEMVLSESNVYRKELIYTGSFTKTLPDGTKQNFDITLEDLKHFQRTFLQFSENGIEVPVPSEHSTDPEKRRGTLINVEIAKNDKGLDAIFGFIKFNDAQTASQHKNNNVSIYVPKTFVDGKNNEYTMPIRHVALTDYPVIPDLGKFELVASFTQSNGNKMDKLAALLGIDPAAPDLEAALSDAITKLMEKVKQLGDKPPAPAPGANSNPPAPAPAPGANSNPPAQIVPEGLAASMSSMFVNSRQTTIDSLVGKYITPAVADTLKKTYCDQKAISLSLSSTGNVDSAEFDRVIDVIKLNGPTLDLREKSGAQLPDALKLSDNDIMDSKKNPLIASAERMAARK